MPLRVSDVEQAVAGGGEFREDIARSEVLEYRPPRTMDGRFAGPFPVRRVGGLSMSKAGGGVQTSTPPTGPRPPLDPPWEATSKPAGVEQTERSSGETGTHALPAVEKITGKPSEAAHMHRMARQVQNLKRHLGVHVWYGEHTREFWVMDANGLHPFKSLADMNQGMGW